MSTVSRIWTWIQSHPLTADAALAVALLGAGLVSSDMTIDLFEVDPSVQPADKSAVAAGLSAMVLPLALRRDRKSVV